MYSTLGEEKKSVAVQIRSVISVSVFRWRKRGFESRLGAPPSFAKWKSHHRFMMFTKLASDVVLHSVCVCVTSCGPMKTTNGAHTHVSDGEERVGSHLKPWLLASVCVCRIEIDGCSNTGNNIHAR